MNQVSNLVCGMWLFIQQIMQETGGFKEILEPLMSSTHNGDFDAPVISNVQVTPQGDVQVGESVTVTAK